ncbi:MAG: ribonuclease R [Desulfovibrionaceae bacterium]
MTKKRKNAAKESGDSISSKRLLRVFSQNDKPLTITEILNALGLSKGKKAKKPVKQALYELMDQGKLIKTGRAYGLTERMSLVKGVLEVHRSGIAFVIPEDKRRKDIFVRSNHQGDAWHGDKVMAAVTRERRGKNPEGRVVRILERGLAALPAVVQRKLGGGMVLARPADPKLDFNLMLKAEKGQSLPAVGQIALAAPGERLEERLWEASLLDVLGQEEDVSVQERLVKLNHQIPTEFPAEALAQAENLPQEPTEQDFEGRADLRGVGFVTIDGAKARDFDDAVYVERTGDGYRLHVAIADVSHYVPEGSPLDVEAFTRANSYYFPQSVEPMFPPRLSNGLCSLNPQVNRLAVAASMDFSSSGEMRASSFTKAVIKSNARLTYSQVHRALHLNDQDERLKLKPVLPMLEIAEELARALNRRRKDRGSIDFDLPEPEIMFNIVGETVDIRPKARNFAHQIIEEFMIAANEAVAEHLENLGLPCMYRIHPAPDIEKLESLFELLSHTELGPKVPKEPSPKALQELIRASEDTDMEFLVSRLLLRSMKQAQYHPVNEGHFGLASESYCHFTSPIRRYADLMVHRILKRDLGDGRYALPRPKRMEEAAGHLSRTERTAMEAEREILKRLTCLLLRERVGQTFTGVISSLSDFGFFVELAEVMADGLVRLSRMHDDYYAFLPKEQILLGSHTGRVLKLGQKVQVVLEDVNLSRLEIDLALAE